LRKAGIMPGLPYMDWLKDERRKINKVDTYASTRIFCMSPLSNTVHGRMNYLHFAAAYRENRLKLQHAVGISVDGPEWSYLANSLIEFSPNIMALDYKNFGPGYNAMVNAGAHEILMRWTMKYVLGVTELEMEVQGEEHYNSLHLMFDLLYRQLSGGPSGDTLTVIKNGIVNELYVLLAWRKLCVGKIDVTESNVWEQYFRNVLLYTYGDDLISAVKQLVAEWFNSKTLIQFFAKYKIEATDALKTGEIKEFINMDEATFLKCHFRRHPIFRNEWLAPLDIVSVRETAKWIFQSADDVAATRENADAALRNAYGHGESIFNELKEQINNALVQAEIQPILLTWKEMDQNFFKHCY